MQPSTIRVRIEIEGADTIERTFARPFTLGRVPECDIQVPSGMISRVHAEVVYEAGQWWIYDRNSTNGVFQEGVRITQAAVGEHAIFRLGKNGPVVRLQTEQALKPVSTRLEHITSIEDVPPSAQDAPPSFEEEPAFREEPSAEEEEAPEWSSPLPPLASSPGQEEKKQDETVWGLPAWTSTPSLQEPHEAEDGPKLSPKEAFEARRRAAMGQQPTGTPPAPATPPDPPKEEAAPAASGAASTPRTDEPSVDQVIARYFDAEDDTPAGERTMLIRHAYKAVKKKEKRKYTGIIVAVGVLFLLAAGFAVFKQIQDTRQQRLAQDIFVQMKQQDLRMAQVIHVVAGREDASDAELQQLVEDVRQDRQRLAAQYNGYVKELGLYRKLSEEEELIFRVARIFNESEFGMPAGFIREVRRTIHEHWQGPGRRTYITAVERAQQNGYIPVIVETMQEYGLPPEFFYLSMQESVFDVNAVGPATRWGIAKGMWQFIPSTARRYGLRPGPREDLRVVDEQDERHDFRKATEAAAKYLLDIYSTPAQASGLLVIASYNWGEHRVVNKLEELPGPQAIPEEAFAGIPLDPSERTYWRFLNEYSDRMPEETKDYVLKIFAAAVIGQNPRLFGFDFDNPLQPYMEIPGDLVE